MLTPTIMFMDCIRKQTHQCAQYKLNIVYKIKRQKQSGKHVILKNIKFLGFHAVVLVNTFPLMY